MRKLALVLALLLPAAALADGLGLGLDIPDIAVKGRAFSTWNPSDLNAITLSNGNLTATSTGAPAGVRGTASHATGKWCAEFIAVTVTGVDGVGFANASSIGATNANGFGGDNNSVAQFSAAVFLNNASIGTSTTFAANGTVLDVCLDFDAKKWWSATNGGNWNNDVIANQNPATGAGGFSFAGIGAGPYFLAYSTDAGAHGVTLNTGASAFAKAIPAGYSAWH